MSLMKNYIEEQERLEAMDASEAMLFGEHKHQVKQKHNVTRKKSIRPRCSYRGCDYLAFDDPHGVFQIKHPHEMTEADWRWFEQG